MELTIGNQTKTLEQWSEQSTLTPLEIHLRISSGVPAERAVFQEKNDDPEYPPNDNPRKRHTRFRGVTWHAKKHRWYARICVDGINYGLGYHREELAAAIAYNKAAREMLGGDAEYNYL